MPEEQLWTVKRLGQNVPEAFLDLVPDLHPVLARVLYARGLADRGEIDTFLAAEGSEGDPLALPDMAAALDRLQRAISAKEKIAVYGDFDVDGTTATSLLVTALQRMGAIVEPYIPDRFSEAYGLNTDALSTLHDRGVTLVVTVDCGIRSLKEVAFANTLGLDMILTDHHSVPEKLPQAVAVIDPKRPDSAYPYDALAGVGVAYRLAQALEARLGLDRAVTDDLIDLVALGTVADIVPLTGENRLLAARGLARMREFQRPGIRQLMQVSSVQASDLTSQSIGFRMGPRINAAGRLKHAMLAYRLLTADTDETALALATELDQLNKTRQDMLGESVALAESLLGDVSGGKLIFLANGTLHEGLVGLVAGRLADRYYRPALAMRVEEDGVRGSARSIEGFHITHALEACDDLLERYGGHEQAAGFSLKAENLDAFRERMTAYCEEHIQPGLLRRRFSVDAMVSLHDLDDDVPDALARLEPCGEGNPSPSLASVGLNLDGVRAVGRESSHLQLTVSQGNRHLRCIAFRMGHLAQTYRLGQRVDLIYRPQMNEWNGYRNLQLVVEAIRPSRT